MASYLQKLRRQSKQMVPQWEPKVAGQESNAQEAPKVESTTTAGPSEATVTPPAPAVRFPDEETDKEPEMDEEDKKFLERLAAIADEPEGQAPPLPTRPVQPTETVDIMAQQKAAGRNAQEALMDGADKGKGKATDGGKKSVLSYFSLPKFAKKDEKDKKKAAITDKDRAQFADDLQAAAQSAKNAEPADTRQEDKELTEILDQLNVSAVNNRVFSFSKESEELFNKFTQVLKDLVNGVPTAYDDLEKLFTDYDNQLKKMYGSLPPFLQNLVKSLPAKLTATLGPEILAASAEKPGFDAKQASGSKSKRSKIPSVPSLKSLISAQGAVATALRSIISFIKLRFPTLALGTNAIVSVAVFVLLFVFWYCHKRGRETRLEKERLAAEEAQSGQASSASSINGDADSIFGSQIRAQKEQGKKEETPKAPLIINDGKEGDGRPTGVDDLPSVAHLPDPKAGEVPRTATPPPVSK